MMIYKDFENKPLPEHIVIDYYESLTKIVLEAIFPDGFKNLEIKDKPDLQNIKREIGIEVTRAINPKQEQNEKLYVKINHKQVRNKEKAIEEINSSYKPYSIVINGKEFREPDRLCNGILMGIPESDNFGRVFEAYKNKVEKLNKSGYRIFSNNYLFVHSEILADQQMINEVIVKMNKFKENYEKTFRIVFVYVPDYIYILDLEKEKGEIRYIKEYQYDWAVQARKMVIQYEIGKVR